MTGHFRRFRLGITVALLALAAIGWPSAQAQDPTLRLRLLSTTDIHTHIVDYDYYRDQPDISLGLARTATLIRQARAEVRNSLLFDSGDLIQGNPLGDYVAVEQRLQPGQVHPVFKAMNQLDYAAATLGNHEFNYGLDFLRTTLAGANFPYVTSNVFVAGPDRAAAPPLIQPFVILDRDFVDEGGATRRLRVGAIGFVPPQIMQWDRANLDGRVFVIDIVEAARRYVPQMRAAGADLVVALVHSGLSATPARGMDENAAAYLAQVPGIDAILAGHSHLVFPGPSFASLPGADIARGTIHGVPTVMAGFWGSHVGVVDLTLRRTAEGWRRVDGTGATRGIRRRENNQWVAAVEPDPAILAAVQPEHHGTLAYVRRPVARSTARIHSYFALVQDDPSVQLVARAQTAYIRRVLQGTPQAGLPVLSAAAPFKAGGRGGPRLLHRRPGGGHRDPQRRRPVPLPEHGARGARERRHPARVAGDVGRPVQPHRPGADDAAAPGQHRLPDLQLRRHRRGDLSDRRDPAGALHAAGAPRRSECAAHRRPALPGPTGDRHRWSSSSRPTTTGPAAAATSPAWTARTSSSRPPRPTRRSSRTG